MPALFQIADAYRDVIRRMDEWAEAHDGDATEFQLLDELSALEGSLEEKVLSIACLHKEEAADGKAIKELGESLVKRGQAKENRAKRLKESIAQHLPAGAKFEDQRAAVAWQKNGGKEAVEMFPEVKPEELPAAYQVVTITANTDRIREVALEAGEAGTSSTGYPGKVLKVDGKPLAVAYRGAHVRIR
jgi:hypothetical protein